MVLSLAACGGTSAKTPPAATDASGQTEASGSSTEANNTADGPTYNWSVANDLAAGAPWDLGLVDFASR
jgi:hypothetical protein